MQIVFFRAKLKIKVTKIISLGETGKKKKAFSFHANGMECQSLFSGENKKTILKSCLLKFLPSMQSAAQPSCLGLRMLSMVN